MKEMCFIKLSGCDDSTLIEMQLNNVEINFLEKIAEKSKENSNYCCMPTMRIIKGEEAEELEAEIFDSLINDY